jgi:hypothetical protein
MKQFLLFGISILAVSACAPEAPPQPPPAAAASAAQSAPGSTTNTTTIFDGAYTQGVIQNASASAGKSLSECPNLTVAQAVIIRKGLAQLQVNNGRVNSSRARPVKRSRDKLIPIMFSEVGRLGTACTTRLGSERAWGRRTFRNCWGSP